MPKDYSNETIIVGNGPSINTHRRGALIDSFGTVIRLNRFYTHPPKAVTECTGVKTDVWATKRAYGSDIQFSKLKTVLFLLINHKHTAVQRKKLQKLATGAEFIEYPSGLLADNDRKMERYVKSNTAEVLKYTKGCGKVVPSTGLNVIAYCTQTLPYVYVTGFDLMKSGRIHYWGDDVWANWTHVSKANVYPAEQWAFSRYVEKGRVKVLHD